ncbi:Low molecular weight phosphotyrosine protein phosphatase [Planctomycetales bacterium 10988]|nr:Low molecular weight phosphotyrosine protein phosphatase [Planctomycetales bacterium 10988]
MTKPLVLFLCNGNSARSQMAEAFLRHFGGDHYEALSGGLRPVGIHPLTIRVMEEKGIRLEGHHSKSLGEFFGKISPSYVFFVCQEGEVACPKNWPFMRKTESWPFPDPAAFEGTDQEKLDYFREVRDQIESKVNQWLSGQTPENVPFPNNSKDDDFRYRGVG